VDKKYKQQNLAGFINLFHDIICSIIFNDGPNISTQDLSKRLKASIPAAKLASYWVTIF
jgi:hypothetical protein